MREYVKNPLTGRMVQVNGPTYKKVVQTHPSIKKAKRVSSPEKRAMSKKKNSTVESKTKAIYQKAPPANIKKEAKTIPKSRKALIAHATDLGNSGRGSRTRGWSISAPQRGTERNELKRTCGNSCFLIPEKQKFPICKSLRTSGGKCEVDCRGLAAAKIRARQYGYTKVSKEAERLEKIYGC